MKRSFGGLMDYVRSVQAKPNGLYLCDQAL